MKDGLYNCVGWLRILDNMGEFREKMLGILIEES